MKFPSLLSPKSFLWLILVSCLKLLPWKAFRRFPFQPSFPNGQTTLTALPCNMEKQWVYFELLLNFWPDLPVTTFESSHPAVSATCVNIKFSDLFFLSLLTMRWCWWGFGHRSLVYWKIKKLVIKLAKCLHHYQCCLKMCIDFLLCFKSWQKGSCCRNVAK